METVGQCETTSIDRLFGKVETEGETQAGEAFFSNAELPKLEQADIVNNRLSNYLYRTRASTAIDTNGIAKQGSLRVMQVCLPTELEGTISVATETDLPIFEAAFKWLRHVGVNRNRGLGRCQFSSSKINSK